MKHLFPALLLLAALAGHATDVHGIDMVASGGMCWLVGGDGERLVGFGGFSCHYPKTVSRSELEKARKKRSTPVIPQVALALDRLEPLGNDRWKVHFTAPPLNDEKGAPIGLKDCHVLVSAAPDGRVDLEFHVEAPAGGRFGGKPGVVVLRAAPGVVFQKRPLASSYWKRPETGVAYEARGVPILVADAADCRLFATSQLMDWSAGPDGPAFHFRWMPLDPDAAAAADEEYMTSLRGPAMPATEEFANAMPKDNGNPAPEDEKIIAIDEAPDISDIPDEIVNHPLAFSGGLSIFVEAGRTSPALRACEVNGQPFLLSLLSSGKLNLFDADKAPPDFTIEAVNACRGPVSADMRVFVKNWDGETVLEKSEKVRFKTAETKTWRFEIPSPAIRDFYFVEASFVAEDGRESFARTHLATLPPYEYAHRDTSLLGCQCDYPLPDWDSLRALMKRMGVHWIRGCGQKFWSQEDGMETIAGFGAPMGIRPGADRLEAAKNALTNAHEYGASIMEIGPNELNLKYIYGGDSKKDVENLMDWAKTFYEARKQLKLEKAIRLSTFGNGGSNGGVVEALARSGAYEFLDLLSLHPGRLCSTPDSIGPDWAWHYTAMINHFRWTASWKRPPDREIGVILTEVYARTPPFARDSDSLRAAAENVLLSLILAKAYDVYALTWYKSHDGAYWDINGVNEWNTEYHYGLLLRDGTVKPSILAFCAAAEALDGAEFEKTVTRSDGNIYRSWSFTSPKGPFTVAVDRRDGYGAYPWDDFPGFMDPWIEHWKTSTDYVFSTTGATVRVVDAIGREKFLTPVDGKVTIPLSGSPQIIYGIDPVPLAPAVNGEAKEVQYASGKVVYADTVAYREGFYEVRRHLEGGDVETLAVFAPIKGVVSGALTPLRRNWALNPEGDEVVFRTVPGATPTAMGADGTPLKVAPAGEGLVKVRIGKDPIVLRGVGTSVSDGVVWTPREYPPYVNDHDEPRKEMVKGLDEAPDPKTREGRRQFDMGAPTVPDMLDDMID